MAYAIEKIWAGYLSAYNKDVYRAKFDIYPLRDFDYWMRDLGASRQDNGNFLGNMEEIIDWVDMAEKEMEDRYKKYIKNKTEAEETKEKNIEDLNEKTQKLLDQKKEKEKELDDLKKEKKIRDNAEKNARNQDQTKVYVPGLEYRSETEIQSEIDRIEKERLNIEKEIESAQKSLKELKSSVKMGFEDWKKNQEILTFNEDYRKYDLGNRSFRTAGPFCIEKQEYFRDVYSKGLKEFHFDTEFRNFETNPQKKPKDIGNQILNIVHRKGSGYPTSNDSNTTFIRNKNLKNSKDIEKYHKDAVDPIKENVDKVLYGGYIDVKKYVAALWALTWAYGNSYNLIGKDNDTVEINGEEYNIHQDYLVTDYIELMQQIEVDYGWVEPVKNMMRVRVAWRPKPQDWNEMENKFRKYSMVSSQYKIMSKMWIVYENLVKAKIINPAKPEDLK